MYVRLSEGDFIHLMLSSPIAIHFLPNTVTFFFMAEENSIINAYHLSLDQSSSVVHPAWLCNFADVSSADKHECAVCGSLGSIMGHILNIVFCEHVWDNEKTGPFHAW